MKLVNVTDKEQLKELTMAWAMTWEGLSEESFEEALEECGGENAKGYLIKGKDMNAQYHLTGTNAYPDDLTIFSIDKYKCLAIMVGARWMDDILSSNADREGYYPFNC